MEKVEEKEIDGDKFIERHVEENGGDFFVELDAAKIIIDEEFINANKK